MNIFLLIQTLIVLVACAGSVDAEEPRIGMLIEKKKTATYIETLQGFRGRLEKSGRHYTFIEKNAGNDREKMEVIAKEFAADPQIQSVVVLGSAAVRIVNQHVTTKPVVFGGINHPGKLGISGDNITGTTYYIDPSAIVNLIAKLNPDVRKVGVLYEPPEQNAASVVEVPETEKALRQLGIDYVKETVVTREAIAIKTKQIIDAGAEYLIIPTNRLLYSNVSLIREVSDKAGVPIVSFSRKGVAGGALIGLTSNNRVLGEKMALMLIEVVEGIRSPQEIEWYFPKKYSILVNETTRVGLGVQIPRKIYGIATKFNGEKEKGID